MSSYAYVRHWSPWSIALVALVALAWAWINRSHLLDEMRSAADWWRWKRRMRG